MRLLPHWLEELSPSESIDFYRDCALTHALAGGSVGQRIAKLIRNDDLRGLCEFELDINEVEEDTLRGVLARLEGVSSSDFVREFQRLDESIKERTATVLRECRQALAFFQKVEHLDIGVDKKEVALAKFLEAEELCRSTNALFKSVRSGAVSLSPRVSSVLHTARLKVSHVLGRVPKLGELDLRFGPGATRATRKTEASVRRKLAERLQCSEELLQAIPYVLEELPHLTDIHSTCDITYVDSGDESSLVSVEVIDAKLSFVPKSAKTYRSICTEPGLNVLVQAGYGAVIARRLRAVGVDIRDQSVNQERAKSGSLTGALATLDLSSASDTIATELVFELLPLDWATALNRARSRKVVLPNGTTLSQEKFSSMGNGFTFPLETLIFWSLAAACCSKDSDATVYGDDIIVPTAAYDLLTEVLHVCGFVVNLKKSYASGPFRESCGKDYIYGIDVRPYYPRGWVSAQSLFVLHNFYVRRGDYERADHVLRHIHPALVQYGPDGFGDGHLLGDHPKWRKPKYEHRGYSGYFFDTYVTGNPRDKLPLQNGEWVVPLYTIYRRSCDDWGLPDKPHKGASRESLCFWLKYQKRAHGPSGPAPLSLPGKEDKELPLPGVAGYKKISVYTLGV